MAHDVAARREAVAGIRSLLFAPANEPRKVARIASFGSDAFVLDLEDAVAESERDEARQGLAEALGRTDHPGTSAVRCVRINRWQGGVGREDLAQLPVDLLDAIVVPKVESAGELQEIDALLRDMESAAGLAAGWVGVIPLIETARGVVELSSICAGLPGRVIRFIFGSGDFTADLGLSWTPMSPATVTARALVVIHSHAAGLAAPLDGPYLDIHDLDGLRRDCTDSWAQGLGGRVVVYPKQVDTVQEVYGGQGDVARAQRLVEAFETALADGSASIQFEGTFVDYPIYEEARRRVSADGGSTIET